MAESVLRHIINNSALKNQINWEIDSAALRCWNIGCYPTERCLQVLFENDMQSDHIGRQIKTSDFEYFDYIFGMDDGNIDELRNLAPKNCHAKIELLGDYYGKNDKIILDPYFENGIEAFQKCFEKIQESCRNFVSLQLSKIKDH